MPAMEEAADQDAPKTESAAAPSPALKQLGELAMTHEAYPDEALPRRLQEIYMALEQHDYNREQAGRDLGMTSIAEVVSAEAAIAARFIRALPKNVQKADAVRAIHLALAHEVERLADAEPFAKREPPALARALPIARPKSPPPQPTLQKEKPSSPHSKPKVSKKDTQTGQKKTQPLPTKAEMLRGALGDINNFFSYRRVDVADFLSGRHLEAYKLFTNTTKDGRQIAEETGFRSRDATFLLGRLIETLVKEAPDLLAFPQPVISYEEDAPETKKWAKGERFEVFRKLGTLVSEQRVDMSNILTPFQQEVFAIVTDLRLSDEEVDVRVGKVASSSISALSFVILNAIIRNVPSQFLELAERRRAAIEVLNARGKLSKRMASPGVSMRETLRQIDHILRTRTSAGGNPDDTPETLLASAPELHRELYPLFLNPDLTLADIAKEVKTSLSKEGVRYAVDSIVLYLTKKTPHILGFKPPLITFEELNEQPPLATELREAAEEPWLRGERQKLMPHLRTRLEKLQINYLDVLAPSQGKIFELLTTTDIPMRKIAEILNLSDSVVKTQLPLIMKRCSDFATAELLNIPALRRAARESI